MAFRNSPFTASVALNHHKLTLILAGLSFLLLARTGTEAAEITASCSGSGDGSDGTCPSGDSSVDIPLRWRASTYNKEQTVYGGDHVLRGFAKWFEGPDSGDDWDVLWTHSTQVATLTKRKLPPRRAGRRLVNNCDFFKAAGQKCYFHGHVGRIREAIANDGARSARFTYLRSYVLNHDAQFKQWRAEVRAAPDVPWVLKECSAGLSQGIRLLRGDSLLKAANQQKPKTWTVAQEYLQRPFMGFGGRKFHLRVYVLVTSWGPPPSVFVYNEGVLFRSRQPYDPERLSEGRDVFSAISSDVEGLPHGSLWKELDVAATRPGATLPNSTEVREHMAEVLRELFGHVSEKSFEDPKEFNSRAFDCFDFFGLDVMLDEALRPIVLEINYGPNLAVDDRGEEASPLLRGLKEPMIAQMAEWMALRVRRAPRSKEDALEIEGKSLRNFSRIL